MKKVLYVSANGYLGGAERFVLTAVTAHQESKNIKASILFFSDGEACEEAKSQGLTYHILKNGFRFRYPWKLIKTLLEIRAFVKKDRPDILQLTMPYTHIVMSLATFGMGIPKVWFQHGPVGGKLDLLANFFPVDIILYNSMDLQLRHNKTWPHAHIKLEEKIIHYGVSSKCLPHDLFRGDMLRIGSAGRICSWKGYHNLLTALGELKQEGHQFRPFTWTIAGSAKRAQDIKYKKSLDKLIKKFDLSKLVTFQGHVTDMEKYYLGLDIFIHSSIIPEPFGLVVAEAMLNGCLVIASDAGGVTDILKNNITGISFSATSPNAINELKIILKSLLCARENFDREKLRAIANNGKEFIKENYSVNQMNTQLESIYSSIS